MKKIIRLTYRCKPSLHYYDVDLINSYFKVLTWRAVALSSIKIYLTKNNYFILNTKENTIIDNNIYYIYRKEDCKTIH